MKWRKQSGRGDRAALMRTSTVSGEKGHQPDQAQKVEHWVKSDETPCPDHIDEEECQKQW